MSNLFELMRLIESKNEINRRRRKYNARISAARDKYTKSIGLKSYWHTEEIPSGLSNQLEFHKKKTSQLEKVIKEINKWMDRYEAMKSLGKKRTPRLRRMAKKLNAKMRWDASGYCYALSVKVGDEIVQYNNDDMKRIAEHVKIENILFGGHIEVMEEYHEQT
jgi:uncharacterized FlaG/YvyC family protein